MILQVLKFTMLCRSINFQIIVEIQSFCSLDDLSRKYLNVTTSVVGIKNFLGSMKIDLNYLDIHMVFVVEKVCRGFEGLLGVEMLARLHYEKPLIILLE